MRALPLLLLLAGSAQAQTPCDTGLDADCDGDGWTPAEGDCDDADRTVRPGRDEVCDDGVDNNCDGLFDEDCEAAARAGQLQGGGGCTGGNNLGAWLLLAPLVARRKPR
jgi:hypothetical protein